MRAIGELASDDIGPQVRIGIATGAAIVGDVLATDASAQSELATFWATPNLAARLQGQAQPNQVLVSETTQDLTREQFEYARMDVAERQPVLLAVEDLHWVDPTTRDFLGLLVEAIREQRIFALMTYRPEIAAPWINQRHLTTLTLNHLTEAECRQLVRGLDAGYALPNDLVEQIVNRTDGVPLFVEELLRTVLEAGSDSGDAIPETLRDALTARLDRLGEAKRVAQLASVIGRVFPLPLLQAASGMDTNALQASLDQLVSSGLAYRRTLSGGEDYAFKHALIRDCAYQSLLRDERRDLHRRVALSL